MIPDTAADMVRFTKNLSRRVPSSVSRITGFSLRTEPRAAATGVSLPPRFKNPKSWGIRKDSVFSAALFNHSRISGIPFPSSFILWAFSTIYLWGPQRVRLLNTVILSRLSTISLALKAP